MIYFLQNTLTSAIKIGFSFDPEKRKKDLQQIILEPLNMLGTIQGSIPDEKALHLRFDRHKLGKEWFKPVIHGELMALIRMDVAAPLRTNVLVGGDSDKPFAWSSDPQQNANKAKLEALVFQHLDQIHAKTPIAWVVTGGANLLDFFVRQWVNQHKGVQLQPYYPNWARYRNGAPSRTAQQMLHSQFDPKMVLVFLNGKVTAGTQRLIKGAEKKKFEMVKVLVKEPPPVGASGKQPIVPGASTGPAI